MVFIIATLLLSLVNVAYIYVGSSYLWGIVEAVWDGPTAQ